MCFTSTQPPNFLVFVVISFLVTFQPITYMHSSFAICITRPAHLPGLRHSDYSWWRVQVPKLFVMQLPLSTAWRGHGSRMEDTTSRYWRYLWEYRIRSRNRQVRDGPPAWWLGAGLTIRHIKISLLPNVTTFHKVDVNLYHGSIIEAQLHDVRGTGRELLHFNLGTK